MLATRGAIPADVGAVASELRGLVVLACLVRDAEPADVGVGARRVPAVACAAGLAVQQHLRGQADLRPGALAVHGDAVRQRRGDALGPAAGASAMWQVLVGVPRHPAPSRHVTPIPLLGQSRLLDKLVRPRGGHALAAVGRPVVARGAAGAALLRGARGRRAAGREEGLLGGGEGEDLGLGLVLLVLLLTVADVDVAPDRASPVAWRRPCAIRLDHDVVLAARYTGPAVVAPIGAPRVADDPVVLAILGAVPDH
mmetsp:Transcript_946/g.2117  ORF Transcript_946/g.2117 Transcript_946/m.2117 type:complete len:254 (-) Transcript_946:815-1576(-)